MSFELSVLPSGLLSVGKAAADVESDDSKVRTLELRLSEAFEEGQATGLFYLATLKNSDLLSPAGRFWREFAGRYLSSLCHASFTDDGGVEAVECLSRSERATLLLRLPPMPGAEYVDDGVLVSIWEKLDEWVRGEVSDHEGGLAGFLAARAPLWHRLGRVCFHLAENRRDPERPFAFMATYSQQLTLDGARVQYQPLSRALKEYAGARNKSALVRLLSPVNEASKGSPLIAELVDSGGIYHPLAWRAEQAHQFLKDVEKVEAAGVLVRLPDWWRKRARPQVSVRIGDQSAGQFGVSAMLDFRMSVSLGEAELTQEELNQLLEGDEGLVLLKGQWVEVDKGRLSQALKHWEALEQNNPEGISFIEGMRLLAGAPSDLRREGGDPERQWSFVQAGQWLGGVLDTLRCPDHVPGTKKRDGLNGDLRPYQKIGADWLSFMGGVGLGACLADDMGLGKTIQVIAHLLDCKQSQNGHVSLLVLPTSLLGNWKAEINRFAQGLRVCFVHPAETNNETLEQLAENPQDTLKDVDVVLTTYGMLKRQKWVSAIEWDCVVLDEAHAIKNPGAQQTKAVKKLVSKSRVALTGTPVENRLSDLWSLFDFLNPGLLGSATTFKGFVKNLQTKEDYAPLRKLISPYILRRLKTDRSIISDLPDKTEMSAHCTLSRRQASLYQKLVSELGDSLEKVDGIQRRGLVLAYLMRFKQVCNHPSHLLGDGDFKVTDSGKFLRLGELCEEIASRQEKVLIFTQFREMTAPLSHYLGTLFNGPGLVLHGGVGVRARQEMVSQFQQSGGPSHFVLSLKAGGVGLNLTAACHVIHFDRWWNPAIENQATDRAFRIGQKSNVLVHKFISLGTVEEKIDALIESKKRLSDELLKGGGEQLLTEMSNEELVELVSLDIERASQ